MQDNDMAGLIAERLLKLAIALVLLSIVLAPVLVGALHFASPLITDSFARLFLAEQYRNGGDGGIAGGPDFAAVDALEDKLTKLTAFRGEAKGAASSLQIVAVRFEGANEADGFAPLNLDLSAARDTATIIIANRPARIKLTGEIPARRAILGLEGLAPFDIENAPKGLLSGFRVAAFGAGRVALPDQIIDGADATAFCDGVKRWRTYYDVPQAAVRLEVVRNPKSVIVSDFRASSDGVPADGAPSLDTFCAKY